MDKVQRPKKAQRKLKDINFEFDGAHIALVAEEQGHGANGHHYVLAMKSLNAIQEKESTEVAKSTQDDTSINLQVEKNGGVLSPVNKSENDGETMTDAVKSEEVVKPEVEMIEKSQFESIAKALEDQKVELQKAQEELRKAQEQIEKAKQAEKEAIQKSKTEKIEAVFKNKEHVAAVVKAGLSLESEDDFSAFVAAIQAMMATVETSEMFVEKGMSTQEQEAPEESKVRKLIKAKYGKQQ